MLHKNDQINFWKKVYELIGTHSAPGIECVFKYGTDMLGIKESVEEVNRYFAQVGERVSAEINSSTCEILDNEVVDTAMNFFNRLTVTRFLEILSELNLSKSSGIPELNSRLIINAMKTRPEVFVHICNASLNLGIFPEDCKRAQSSIIPKKGDKRILDNLRPISLLCLLGKVMEKHVKYELVNYFELNGLFFDNQAPLFLAGFNLLSRRKKKLLV